MLNYSEKEPRKLEEDLHLDLTHRYLNQGIYSLVELPAATITRLSCRSYVLIHQEKTSNWKFGAKIMRQTLSI